MKVFITIKEELKQVKYQVNHCFVKLKGTMSKSAQVETSYDAIASKDELIKLLRGNYCKLKSSGDG